MINLHRLDLNLLRTLDVLLEGLGRLEYRGYDSAGVALVGTGSDRVASAKRAGKLVNLREALAEAAPRADLAAEGRDAVAAVVEVLRAAAEHGLDLVVVGAPV